MKNQSYTEQAVRVVEVSPYPSESNVQVNSVITIKANTVLDLSSIESAIKLIVADNFTESDIENNYDDIFEKSEYINCIITSSNNKRDVILEPRDFLKINTKYIILVNGLRDVFQNPQFETYYSFFDTGTEEVHKGTELIFPANKTVVTTIPEFKWIRQNTTEYVLQISSSSSFEELNYNQTIRHSENEEFDNTIQIVPELIIDEGTYFWHVKAMTGVWSKTYSFYYQPINIIPVSNQDIPYRDAAIMDYFSQTKIIEITEDSISDYLINPKAALFLKINKLIDVEDINDLILVNNNTEEELNFDFSLIHLPTSEETIIIIHPIINETEE